MSIISNVGRRSPSLRAMIILLYVVLSAGALTIVYPLALMLSTSVTSSVDVDEFKVIPSYFHDDDVLFAKFLEEKYIRANFVNQAYGKDIFEFREVIPLSRENRVIWAAIPAEARRTRMAEWDEFMRSMPLAYRNVCFLSPPGMTGRVEAMYRAFVSDKFHGDYAECRKAYQEDVTAFRSISVPFERLIDRDYLPDLTRKYQDFLEFKRTLAPSLTAMVSLDVQYCNFLSARYKRNLEDLNRSFGSHYQAFNEIHLPEEAPADGPQREMWLVFVRERLSLPFIGVRSGCARAIGSDAWERDVLPGIDRTSFPAIAPHAADVFEALKRAGPEDLRVLSPEVMYRRFLQARYPSTEAMNERYGTAYHEWLDIGLPSMEADINAFEPQISSCRWRYVTRNYREVMNFIGLHGNALWNTLVLVVLSMATQLLVNPLAAYALSRFRLPYTNRLLMFCLATMAFPPEVSMIPSFLLQRNFPVGPVVAGSLMFVMLFGVWWLAVGRRAPAWIGLTLAGAIAIATGYSTPGGYVPMLNTYSALILPGVANGFAIFLLKGFFDSMPREVYEAATLEGAGEFRMFWQIAVPMSAPVLAVIALGTFTAAYGSFMWALLVCQREDMWTLMVWLYEMQQWAPKYVITAALTLAAIPTLLVFVLCQRFILRGIVLPSMH
ncbi:MAG: carbohydrate ABC transporter permease [Planctomycetes bacterium]|nr:carbohydrate ABC transporter permease [Planctomycetota bacterium]